MPKRFSAKAAGLALTALLSFGAPAGAQNVKRTLLQTTAFPGTQYVTALYLTEADAGAVVPRHTHPGLETFYLLEGELDLPVEGQPDRHLKAGDSIQIPAGVPHGGITLTKPLKYLGVYVVEKDKPLVAIVPQK